MTVPISLGFLLWPDARPLVIALVDEVVQLANQLQSSVEYQVFYWPTTETTRVFPACERLFLVAEEPPLMLDAALETTLRQQADAGHLLLAVGAGVYPLARLGLLDGYQVAVPWRWLDDFSEQFPQVTAHSQLFMQDRQRHSCCGGLALVDLLLAMLSEDLGAELATSIADELFWERLREPSEKQRVPLKNRSGGVHPKLAQAMRLMEENIEEPLTTDEIARRVCVSRRQLERIFRQGLNSVPSQYYLELRLTRARQLLQQTSKSIIQIGLSCGFSSGPHFSSAYRSFFGITPRDDRNQHRALPLHSTPEMD